MFKKAATYNNHTDFQEYTESVTAYIKKCIDDMTVTKNITTNANQKPWMTAEVCGLLKTRDDAFRSGDKAVLKTARANLHSDYKPLPQACDDVQTTLLTMQFPPTSTWLLPT
ncbi:hypothetical protein M9458_051315 [Cirrhinus mrigala]|uniref:Uncharacterized protein n=1 Tax=Cirrhinus mrigala TaxID=683832 RepID=A0ABD0MXT5_CIRMR